MLPHADLLAWVQTLGPYGAGVWMLLRAGKFLAPHVRRLFEVVISFILSTEANGKLHTEILARIEQRQDAHGQTLERIERSVKPTEGGT